MRDSVRAFLFSLSPLSFFIWPSTAEKKNKSTHNEKSSQTDAKPFGILDQVNYSVQHKMVRLHLHFWIRIAILVIRVYNSLAVVEKKRKMVEMLVFFSSITLKCIFKIDLPTSLCYAAVFAMRTKPRFLTLNLLIWKWWLVENSMERWRVRMICTALEVVRPRKLHCRQHRYT